MVFLLLALPLFESGQDGGHGIAAQPYVFQDVGKGKPESHKESRQPQDLQQQEPCLGRLHVFQVGENRRSGLSRISGSLGEGIVIVGPDRPPR